MDCVAPRVHVLLYVITASKAFLSGYFGAEVSDMIYGSLDPLTYVGLLN